ncbi:MAG: TetR/AcrR family transcriptional regulator [Bacteroidia bacterium]
MKIERSQAKLDQILTAAQKRFGHYGLSKTTMNDIADDIRMSKASLYYYFKDKESIFNAVAQKEQAHFVQEMQKIMDVTNQAEWMLLEYVKRRIDLLKKMLTLGKFSHGSYLEIRPLIGTLLNEFRKKEINLIATILKIGIKNKEFKIDNIGRYAEFFIDTLRSIRRGIVVGYADGEMLDVPPKKYFQLKNHSHLFAELFIKGIANKSK